ncbi:hypothetical protein GCK72_025545 [Caenorhabditis remanei]|uniref:Peptidase A1 domain-containing protein n=1 Tax=Caenorhabditis remanei TaxID=31234 RepID=A0A6A5G2A3_CAERE|nr:hypothetical protein GCK72_025545 [Caenorhabditis remanei]KAF1749078.1 hypothetical protein GCK72_025545 [Caenorhabditis remanei]
MDMHNQSGFFLSGADSSFGVLAVPYDGYDIMLTDINEAVIEKIGIAEDVKHLSLAEFSVPAYPVQGILYGPHSRLMVPLIFQPYQNPDSPAIYVWCLIDTGSPFTCLSVKTLEAFYGAGNVVDNTYYPFAIQDQRSRIECQVSRVGTHFEHVNVLGINSLSKLKLNMDINWDTDTFKLIKK